jgi:uncharacterized lipoprotein YajG
MRVILFALGLVVMMTSCATTRDHVTIQYEAIQGTEKVANAETVAIDVKVNDSRESKERVGRKMNGYGKDCASIMSKNDVSVVVKDAISQELKNRGFVLNGEKAADVLVDVDLRKFYNHFTPGFFVGKAISEVVLNVKVLKDGKDLSFAKTLLGTGVNKDVMLYSGENTKIALEEALKNTITDLMNDPAFMDALIQNK